jgi:hypothetical protein
MTVKSETDNPIPCPPPNPKALVPAGRGDESLQGESRMSSVKFAGETCGRGDLLRSPVSGAPCVHWRLRIVEQVNATLQLVHEIASPEDFDVVWSGTGGRGAADSSGTVKIRVVPQAARIWATPVLHRPGSPGAIATGRQFGFLGQLSVEEVTLRAGEEIVAEGILEQPDAAACGPFRGVERDLELFEATVRLPARASLAPVLLPWALGTAAALLGGVGVAAWVARRFDLLPWPGQDAVAPTAEIGPLGHSRSHFSRPE